MRVVQCIECDLPFASAGSPTCPKCRIIDRTDDELSAANRIPMSTLEVERYLERQDRRSWNLPIDEGT